MRRRFKKVTSLKQRLSAMIVSWWESIAPTSQAERDGLLGKIRSAEEAMRIQRWLDSKELKAPQ
ncbi:hypothetical protein [Rhodopseudomonas sp. B29]|uniref:hypothetical protein n=1 Tax=Rhodopseudomonas sp. B29 TaxID=95607 RepID=UPI0011D22A2F|nr:hypothetical protein [Rhodopseudomonas sp. B29]